MQQSGVWVCLGSGAHLRCPLCPARGPLPALPVCMNRFLYDPGILPSQGGFRVPCHLATLWLQSDMPATGRKSLCGLCWWPLLSLCVRPELTRSLSSPRARTRRASWTQIPKPAACWRSVDWQGTARDCGKSPRMKTEAPGQRASWSRGGDSPRRCRADKYPDFSQLGDRESSSYPLSSLLVSLNTEQRGCTQASMDILNQNIVMPKKIPLKP